MPGRRRERPIAWVVSDTGCHECVSHKPGGNGYPCAKRNGEYKKISRMVLEKKLGRPIRPAMMALHTCDNPVCINEEHIYEGSHADNERDKTSRGRRPTGERHAQSKLRAVDVQAIRFLHLIGYGANRISKFFGISQTNASQIIRKCGWKEVKDLWKQQRLAD